MIKKEWKDAPESLVNMNVLTLYYSNGHMGALMQVLSYKQLKIV